MVTGHVYDNADLAHFNGNPTQWLRFIIAIPDLSKGPAISPHTLPLGYIVEPTRYSGPESMGSDSIDL